MTAKTPSKPSSRLDTHISPALLTPPVAFGAILEGSGQLPLLDAAPDPAGAYWMAFTGDHNEDDTARAFLARYGSEPRYVFDGLGGLLFVGPVPEPEDGAL